MELDKRIKEGKRPLTCFDLKEAEKFIGEDGYFAHEMEAFENLDRCYFSRLLGFDTCDKSIPFAVANASRDYEFFIPAEWVKESEKKYREYKNLDEFFEVTGLEIGDLIKLKFPGNNVAELLIVGGCDNGLFIGIHKYTFKQLFEIVEISISGEWKPFGVIEDD